MTFTQILSLSAGLLNDSERSEYTDTAMLPYLNICRLELEQILELNGIPITTNQSATITVAAGNNNIAFGATPPQAALPSDLVDIQKVWESPSGLESFSPVTKVNYLPPPSNSQSSSFGVYSWSDQEVKFVAATAPIDIRLDYIQSLFSFLILTDLTDDNPIVNTDLYLLNRVAGLCAEFIMHNSALASAANGNAATALMTNLGINIKGMQTITTRRRPFRAAFKARTGRR